MTDIRPMTDIKAMTEVERYAVELVADGAMRHVEDDYHTMGHTLTREQWARATDLAEAIAKAIREHPDVILELVP